MGRRLQPRNEKFFALFSKAGSNVVESARWRPSGADDDARSGMTLGNTAPSNKCTAPVMNGRSCGPVSPGRVRTGVAGAR